MAQLNVNFDDVPDEIVPVENGTYEFEITAEPEVMDTVSGSGQKMVVIHRITTPGDYFGRLVYNHISLKMQTVIKRLCLSVGLAVGEDGLNTADLVGMSGQLVVKQQTYRDKVTDEEKTASRVTDYVV